MNIGSTTFDGLLDAIGAKSPTPGGGAVTSAVGALASALGRMVVEYSKGRKEFASQAGEHGRMLDVLDRARWLMLELAAEDMRAYGVLNEAMKLPKDDASRAGAVESAARGALQPPLATMGACVDLLRWFEALAPISNPFLRSDLGIAAILVEATARASRWNVAVNAPFLPEAERVRTLAQADAMLLESARRMHAVEALCR